MKPISKIKRRNLYKRFKKKFDKCVKRIIQKAAMLEETRKIINQLVEDEVIELKYIPLNYKNEHNNSGHQRNILFVKQNKAIKRTPAVWIVFDKKLDFKELWYQLAPSIKQEGYVFIVATQPATKNQFVVKVMLEKNSQLTLYTINEFAPNVEMYNVSLEISLQNGSKLNYNSFTASAPRIFESTVRVHGNKDTITNYSAHFCKTNYLTTNHQWVLSKNSKINVSFNGIVATQNTVKINDEFLCEGSNGEIHFKTDILKISPLAQVRVKPVISIGSTASYNENINITHFKKEYFNYFSRLGFEKEEILDLFMYSYLNPTKFLRSSELCSQFLIL